MRFANQTIAFRVDASLEIGTGHVMRCLTLAEAARDMGAKVIFISRELSGNMIDQMEARGFRVVHLSAPDGPLPEGPPAHAGWAGVHWEQDAAESRVALKEEKPGWLVVDHYSFDERWEKAIRRNGMRILVIDDLADRAHDCELLLDQNLGRKVDSYKSLVSDSCKLIVGPMYALLRPQFATRRSASLSRRKHGRLEHILVVMGGIDQNNITGRVIEAIQQVELPADCRMTIVLGENAPWFEDIKALAKRSKVSTTTLRGVEDMAELMTDADLAIGGAGVSTWERCAVGLPTMLLTMAENQASNAHNMAAAGAALHIGASDDCLRESFQSNFACAFKSENLKRLSERSSRLCDGEGTARVLAEIVPVEVSFRDGRFDDSRRIWEWRQYPGREKFNKSGDEPDFFEHHEWFASAVVDPKRKFRIIQIGKLPCGYCRLDCLGNGLASVSICLSQEARGKRLSKALLREAERTAIEMGMSGINAEVHSENLASIRAFESAGYMLAGESHPFMCYQRRLENRI